MVTNATATTTQPWMRRAFDVDVLACRACGGRLRLIATILKAQDLFDEMGK